MLEYMLPFLKPEGQTQKDIAFAAQLYSTSKWADRLFPTKREDLEEQMLERQLAAMGPNPDSDRLNALVPAVRASQSAPGFLESLFGKVPKERVRSFSVTDALKDTTSNVDFRLAMRINAEKNIFKSGLKAIL